MDIEQHRKRVMDLETELAKTVLHQTEAQNELRRIMTRLDANPRLGIRNEQVNLNRLIEANATRIVELRRAIAAAQRQLQLPIVKRRRSLLPKKPNITRRLPYLHVLRKSEISNQDYVEKRAELDGPNHARLHSMAVQMQREKNPVLVTRAPSPAFSQIQKTPRSLPGQKKSIWRARLLAFTALLLKIRAAMTRMAARSPGRAA
jgi:hypothetical protein